MSNPRAILFTPLISTILACAIVATTSSCKREDENIRRGKELLSIDEYAGARTEFKIAAKRDPSDLVARALLLYSVWRSQKSVEESFEFYPILKLIADNKWPAGLQDEGREEFSTYSKKQRSSYYDEGVDTKDLVDLTNVIQETARFVYDLKKDDNEVDYAAYVLARDGDEKALAHLCERLKSDKATHVPELLTRVGAPAIECVELAAKNPEGLARTTALKILARILAVDLRTSLGKSLSDFPWRLGEGIPDSVQTESGPEPISSDFLHFDKRFIALQWSDSFSFFRTLWSPMGTKGDGLLLVEGYDGIRKLHVGRIFVFKDGAYVQEALTREGKPVDLLQSSNPTVRIRATESGRVELARAEPIDVQEVRAVKRASYARGDRVKIRGIKSAGTVAGTTADGLVQVRLDLAERGESEIDVSEEFLSGLETVTVQKPGYRVFFARLVAGDQLEFSPADQLTERLKNSADAIEEPPPPPPPPLPLPSTVPGQGAAVTDPTHVVGSSTAPSTSIVFVPIPAGQSAIGCIGSENPGLSCFDDESSAQPQSFAALQVMRTEVTVADYGRCVDAGRCAKPPLPGIGCNFGAAGLAQHPMNCVTWSEARAFCTFVQARLPTPDEWEHAARGTAATVFPWGDTPPDSTRANLCDRNCPPLPAADEKALPRSKRIAAELDDGYAGTAPVASYTRGANSAGLVDLVGNVWEWTDGEWRPGIKERRGGSFIDRPRGLRISNRYGSKAETRSIHTGFRCVR